MISSLFDRIMRMESAGLLEFWLKQYSDDPSYCLAKIQREMKEKGGKRRLTLNNLSGAFLGLIIGYIISTIAFIVEHSRARYWQHRLNKKVAVAAPHVPVVVARVVSAVSDDQVCDPSTFVVPKTKNTNLDVEKTIKVVDVEIPFTTTSTTIPPQKLTIGSNDTFKIINIENESNLVHQSSNNNLFI